jgi:3-oxoacyl-[acyl-carrier protein] reductase
MNDARDDVTALVFGGTGYVGSSVLAGLANAGVPTAFTYCNADDKAQTLATRFSQKAHRLDVRQAADVRTFFAERFIGESPNTFIHCIGKAQTREIADISDADWDELQAINVRSAFIACQQLAKRLIASRRGGNFVLTAALDGVKSVQSPIHFSATQGAIVSMTRALAKELGPAGIRVNLVVMGVLDGGLSHQVTPKLRDDYKRFSAMGRIGTAAEVAKAILWLALHNTYMTGATVTIDGGI